VKTVSAALVLAWTLAASAGEKVQVYFSPNGGCAECSSVMKLEFHFRFDSLLLPAPESAFIYWRTATDF
jgi:hypothetical protein